MCGDLILLLCSGSDLTGTTPTTCWAVQKNGCQTQLPTPAVRAQLYSHPPLGTHSASSLATLLKTFDRTVPRTVLLILPEGQSAQHCLTHQRTAPIMSGMLTLRLLFQGPQRCMLRLWTWIVWERHEQSRFLFNSPVWLSFNICLSVAQLEIRELT